MKWIVDMPDGWTHYECRDCGRLLSDTSRTFCDPHPCFLANAKKATDVTQSDSFMVEILAKENGKPVKFYAVED